MSAIVVPVNTGNAGNAMSVFNIYDNSYEVTSLTEVPWVPEAFRARFLVSSLYYDPRRSERRLPADPDATREINLWYPGYD